jgi:general secretion pathway protein D
LVLGGLLEDQLRESDQRVPLLGSIPIIGTLFKSTKTSKVKTNLMVFIRPTILENPEQATFETNKKYNYIRDIQIEDNKEKELRKFRGQDLIGNTDNPILPDFESYEKITQ